MKKLPIDYLGAFGSTVGDEHFPKVKWLSPFDGSNGATTTTDSSDSNSSLTLQGSTQISIARGNGKGNRYTLIQPETDKYHKS